MSKDSKQTSNNQTLQLPNAPEYITNGLEGLSGAIINLGKKNPQQYVPGNSNLQNAAFSMGAGLANRYGANVNPQSTGGYSQGPVLSGGGQGGGGGLFDSLGVKAPDVTQYDYNAIFGQTPHLQNAYNGLSDKDRRDIATVLGIPAGNINPEQFVQFHMENHPQSDEAIQRFRQISGMNQAADPRANQPGRDTILGSQPMATNGKVSPDPQQRMQMATAGAPYEAASLPGQNPLGMYSDAADIARQVATAGPNQVASAQTYNPALAGRTTVQDLPGYDAANSRDVNLGPMAQADAAQVGQMQGYDAAQAQSGQIANMQGYDAAQAQSGLIGALQGYDAANADATTLGAAQGYDPAMIEAQQAYDAAMSAAQNIRGGRVSAQSLLTNLDDYMNPYINDVVDTTLAGFDENAGRIEAQQQAQAAQNGAFGGSRYGVLQAITQGELARERAGTEAGLRSDAFNTGAGLSADDANRRQSASATNAQIATQEALARQQAEIRRAELMFAGAQGDQAAQNQAGAFLADAQNSRTQLQGQLDQQRRLSDQSATNQARQFGADAANTGRLQQASLDQQTNLANADFANQSRAFGADAQNTGTLTQASFDQQTNLVNRDAQDAASQFAANANNNRTLTQAGLNQDANLSNRDALNQGLLAQLDADLSRSIADQNAQNAARQFGAAQTGQQYLTQAGLDQEAMLSNQSAANRSSEFNANTINDLNRFNASQADTALDRALRGADSLRTTGSTQEANERAAIGLLSELGAQERNIQQQAANADIALLSTIAQLFGGLPFNQITGITGSSSGTQTNTPGLLDYLNTGANVVGTLNGA